MYNEVHWTCIYPFIWYWMFFVLNIKIKHTAWECTCLQMKSRKNLLYFLFELLDLLCNGTCACYCKQLNFKKETTKICFHHWKIDKREASAMEATVQLSPGCYLRGHVIQSRKPAKPVYAFLGVPYAEQPKRFQYPEKLKLWQGIRDASKYGE